MDGLVGGGRDGYWETYYLGRWEGRYRGELEVCCFCSFEFDSFSTVLLVILKVVVM